MRDAAFATLCLAVVAAPGTARAQRLAVRLDNVDSTAARQGPVTAADLSFGGLPLRAIFAWREGAVTGVDDARLRLGVARVMAGAPPTIVTPPPQFTRDVPRMGVIATGASFAPFITPLAPTPGFYVLPVTDTTTAALPHTTLRAGVIGISGDAAMLPADAAGTGALNVCGLDNNRRVRVACVQEAAAATMARCVAVWTGAPLNPTDLSSTDCTGVSASSPASQIYAVGISRVGDMVRFHGPATPVGLTDLESSYEPRIVGLRPGTFMVAYVAKTMSPGGTFPRVLTLSMNPMSGALTALGLRPEDAPQLTGMDAIIGADATDARSRDAVALAAGDGTTVPGRATLAFVNRIGTTEAQVVLRVLSTLTDTDARPVFVGGRSVLSPGVGMAVRHFHDLDLHFQNNFGFLVATRTMGPAAFPARVDPYFADLVGWRLVRTVDGFATSPLRQYAFMNEMSPQPEKAADPVVTGPLESHWLLAYTSRDVPSETGSPQHAFARLTPAHGLRDEPCNGAALCNPEFVCSATLMRCVDPPDAGVDASLDAAPDASETGATDAPVETGSDASGDAAVPDAIADATGAPDAGVDASLDAASDGAAPPVDSGVGADASLDAPGDGARADATATPPGDDGISPTPNPNTSFHGTSCSCDVAGRPLDGRAHAGPVSLAAGVALAGLARSLRRRRRCEA